MGWGIGATLVGIAFRMLGIGLAFTIILGLSSLFGSLVPFALHTELGNVRERGVLYVISTIIMLVGVAIVSAAGAMRDRDQTSAGSEQQKERHFMVGLVVAIAAGILSSLLSDGIAFGSPIVDMTLKIGVNPVWASNGVLALLTTGGALPNVVYCVYKLRANKTGSLYVEKSTGSYWLFGIQMGACWYGGLLLYGFGEQQVGTVTGWPLFIGAMILSSSAAGFMTGEWKGAGRRSEVFLCVGSLVIFVALIVIGIAQNR